MAGQRLLDDSEMQDTALHVSRLLVSTTEIHCKYKTYLGFFSRRSKALFHQGVASKGFRGFSRGRWNIRWGCIDNHEGRQFPLLLGRSLIALYFGLSATVRIVPSKFSSINDAEVDLCTSGSVIIFMHSSFCKSPLGVTQTGSTSSGGS